MYWDLCEADPEVSNVLGQYGKSRQDLVRLYADLCAGGLGRWIKGHYVALSTLAYPEPLLFLLETERRGITRKEVFSKLLLYWEGAIRPGALVQLVR